MTITICIPRKTILVAMAVASLSFLVVSRGANALGPNQDDTPKSKTMKKTDRKSVV